MEAVSDLNRRDFVRLLGMLGASSTMLAACGSSKPSGAARRAAPITLSLGESLRSLDIAHGFDFSGSTVQSIAFDGLLSFDEDLRLTGGVMEQFSQPDHRTIVMKLRDGVTFWDGSPVKLEDVRYSILRHLDKGLASEIAGYLARIKSVDKTGPGELTLRLSGPDLILPYALAFTLVLPASSSSTKRLGAPGTDNIMGSGPYAVESFPTPDEVKLKRRAGYWGDPVAVPEITFRVLTDPQSAKLAFDAGEVDGRIGVSVDEVELWRSAEAARIVTSPPLNFVYLTLPMDEQPWSDEHLRRAVAYSVNRDGIVNALLHGLAEPATAVVPPAQWVSVASPAQIRKEYAKLPRFDYDPARAKAEMAQADVPHGFQFEIDFPSSSRTRGEALEAIAEDLKQIGLRMTAKERPSEEILAVQQRNRNVGPQLARIGPDATDPGNYSILTRSEEAGEGGHNFAHIKDPRIDQLWKRQEAETGAARVPLIIDALGRVNETAALIPLWWESTVSVIRDTYRWDGFDALYYSHPWAQEITAA